MSDFLDMDLDFTGVDNAPPPPLPRGTYSARVVDITKKPAKPSTDGRETFSQVWIQVEVEDKKITDFISLHPMNKWKLRAALEAIAGRDSGHRECGDGASRPGRRDYIGQ